MWRVVRSDKDPHSMVFHVVLLSDDAEGQGTSEFLTPVYKVAGKNEWSVEKPSAGHALLPWTTSVSLDTHGRQGWHILTPDSVRVNSVPSAGRWFRDRGLARGDLVLLPRVCMSSSTDG